VIAPHRAVKAARGGQKPRDAGSVDGADSGASGRDAGEQ
jgi:hypothetical protein